MLGPYDSDDADLLVPERQFPRRLPGRFPGGPAGWPCDVMGSRPYLTAGEDRRPTLIWPRQIPIDGDPADVAEAVAAYAAWLEHAPVPKLLISADPGAALTGDQLDYCRSWPHQTEVRVPGLHFIQEDSPDQIGEVLAAWLSGLG